MPLQIPSSQIAAIVKARSLSDASARELIRSLGHLPTLHLPATEMATAIAEHVPSIPIEDLVSILDAISDLYFIREFADVDESQFLDDLIEGMRNTGAPELNLQGGEVKHIRDRFQRLLNVDPLKKLSKAMRLQRDGERLYCEAKILSDIRPVFADDIKSQPVGAVVTHTLKLSYHEGKTGEVREFFVVLDTQDLGALKKIVERADLKGNTLRSLLKRIKLADLGV